MVSEYQNTVIRSHLVVLNGDRVVFLKRCRSRGEVSFYKFYLDKGYAIHINNARKTISRISEAGMYQNVVTKEMIERAKRTWNEKPVSILTFTTEKLFEHHKRMMLAEFL